MKKKTLLNFFVITIIFLFAFSIKVYADTSTSTSIEQINAEILSNVWYSTTTIKEGNNISIYAGFQNHSNKNLSGTAGFFIDDLQISKIDFVASPKSLIKLQSEYKTVRGNHTAQIKIIDIAEVGGSAVNKLSIENLLAKESEKNAFKVDYEMTKEDILKETEKIVGNVVKIVDTQAEKLATYVEGLKDTTSDSLDSSLISKTSDQIVKEKIMGKVLGISDENISDTQNGGENGQTNKISFYNIFLDILSFLIRHWIWVLVIIVVLVAYLAFR